MFDDFSFNSEPKNSPQVISLFNAASRNQLEKLNTIIESHPSIDVEEQVNGFNSVLIAAKKGHLEVIKRIHSLFPTIINSRTSDNQRSSLMLAAFEGHESVVDYLSEFEVLAAISNLSSFVVAARVLPWFSNFISHMGTPTLPVKLLFIFNRFL